ncbi:hypothetical protein SGPA1_30465 [Streptomyces misionensis JCM 4497]
MAGPPLRQRPAGRDRRHRQGGRHLLGLAVLRHRPAHRQPARRPRRPEGQGPHPLREGRPHQGGQAPVRQPQAPGGPGRFTRTGRLSRNAGSQADRSSFVRARAVRTHAPRIQTSAY